MKNTLTTIQNTNTECGLQRLEDRVQTQLSGRVRDLRIQLHEAGIILRGLSRTYYAKQLAQHAVMSESDWPILANEIEVS